MSSAQKSTEHFSLHLVSVGSRSSVELVQSGVSIVGRGEGEGDGDGEGAVEKQRE